MRILIDILIISLFCNGWYLITSQGMVLNIVREWYLTIAGGIENSSGEVYWSKLFQNKYQRVLAFIYKPLFGCVTCMSSIWGSLVYWTIDNSLIYYPIVIIGAACTNLLINKLYDR
jgi:hypothetical protein